MKFTLVIRQDAVIDAGLLGKVNSDDLCFLHYLRGWFDHPKAEIEIVDGRKYVWLRSQTAIEELPLLFNPQAQMTSRRNQLSGMFENLRVAELVETIKRRRLFFRLTDVALRVTQQYDRRPSTTKTASPTVTPSRDECFTPPREESITSIRDEYLPAIIEETGTNESEMNETPPLSPLEGEAQVIFSFWNSFSELPQIREITQSRERKVQERLRDPSWKQNWREGIRRLAASDFAKGAGPQAWRATFDWFIKADSLTKVLEGRYDNRPKPTRKPFPSEIKAQIKAVDELIAEHPANEESNFDCSAPTPEQYEDLRRLRRHRKDLLRQLAGVRG